MVSDVNLTFDKVTIRVVDVPLRRPIVGAVGQYASWPFVLIDVATKEGVVGRSYLEPYLVDSCKYIVPAIEAAAETLTDRPVAPVENLQRVIGGLHLHGRQGVTLIAAAALDMAMWDALAQAAGMPLAVLLGGTIGRVRSYNTNGLWLIPVKDLAKQAAELVDEGGFSAIKMRLGRETLKDDLAALAEVRGAIGEEIHIMSDFNQGLTVAEALHRLHSLDDMGLYWFEEPITFDDLHHCAQLTSQLKTPVQIGENLYGPRDFYSAVKLGAADLYMPDLMQIGRAHV